MSDALHWVEVTALDDPRLDDYRNIRDGDMRRRDVFMAESEVVLGVLLRRSRMRPQSVLIAANKREKLAPVLALLPPGTPVFVAPQAQMDALIGFHIHRGVLAVVERPAPQSPAELLAALPAGPATVVVLEGLTNHDNVGGIFRNAAAFGAAAVLYDRATCDPLYRKSIRVSVGGALLVPFAQADHSGALLDALQKEGFETLALTPRRDAVEVRDLADGSARVALLLGSEGPGLRDDTIARAHRAVRIDIDPAFDSLNVATTSGIALHALRTARGVAP